LLMAGTNDFFCTYDRPAPIPRRLRLRDA
jgi:hypothetical protein